MFGADRRAAGEPGLDGMPVGGGDVEGLAGDLGAREIRNQMLRDIGRAAGVRSDVSPAPTAKPRTAKEAAIASARLSSQRGAGTERRSRLEAPAQAGELLERTRSAPRCGRQAPAGPPHAARDGGLRREAPRGAGIGGERRIVAHLALECERAHGVELAVKRGVEPEQRARRRRQSGHGSDLKVLASMARARASRDITVPTGVSVASAISR